MKQLVQNIKTGKMQIAKVATPQLKPNTVLVKNSFSIVSAGTEGSKVSTARKGYIGKALDKPEQFKQVINTIKNEGLTSTYSKVMNKLDALSPLGYSSSGVVIEVGSDVSRFKVGDRVACAGAGVANHAGGHICPREPYF